MSPRCSRWPASVTARATRWARSPKGWGRDWPSPEPCSHNLDEVQRICNRVALTFSIANSLARQNVDAATLRTVSAAFLNSIALIHPGASLPGGGLNPKYYVPICLVLAALMTALSKTLSKERVVLSTRQ
jgi:hypothetical protein